MAEAILPIATGPLVCLRFVYPDVASVIAHWAVKMTQPDFFEPETQRQFHRDYARAGRAL
jgi:hypothetical protein